jgi:hypothetical protein
MRKKKKKRQNGWWPVGWLYYLNESTSQKVVIIFQPTSLFPDLITNFFLLLSTLVSLSTEIHGQLVESDALMAHHDLFVPKWDGTKIKPKKKERTKKNNKKKKFLFPFQFFFVLFFFSLHSTLWLSDRPLSIVRDIMADTVNYRGRRYDNNT